MTDQTPPVHIAEGDTPPLDGYIYSANGYGVREDLVSAVLIAWARMAPDGDPATTLKSVNDGLLNRAENIARVAASTVAARILLEP